MKIERSIVVRKFANSGEQIPWREAFDTAWGIAGEFGTVGWMIDTDETDTDYEFIFEITPWEG